MQTCFMQSDPGVHSMPPSQKKSAINGISVRREKSVHKPFNTSTHLATKKTSVMLTLSKYCRPEQVARCLV